MTSEQVDARIAELKAQLEKPATRTEIYSRIVGYYRSLHNWNPGKREEYRHRAAFNVPEASRNVLSQPQVSTNRDNRTTFRPDQKGALSSVLNNFEDFDLGERQEGVTHEECESCQ